MITYLLWAVFMLLGFGLGWLKWGRERIDLITPPKGAAQATSGKRRILRPALVEGPVTAHAGPSPFRVVLLDGEVVYDGVSGGEARRHIERIRTYDVEWRAYRNGIPWDHGPRETA